MRPSQAELWNEGAADWAALQEPFALPLYRAVLGELALRRGDRLLDVGCGGGTLLALAGEQGADVVGVDISPGLLEQARMRAPAAELHVADFEQRLPFDDDSFDAVTGFASLHYAADPVAALSEARRVCRPGGRVAVAVWGSAEECQSVAYVATMTSLLPGLPARGPFALAEPGTFEELFRAAGLEPGGPPVSVSCPWEFPDEETGQRALMSVALSAQVAREQGRDRAELAIRGILEPFRREDGSCRLENAFRYLVARA